MIRFFIVFDLKAFERQSSGLQAGVHALMKEMSETRRCFIITEPDLSLILPLIGCKSVPGLMHEQMWHVHS